MKGWLLGNNNLKWVSSDCGKLKALMVKYFGHDLSFYNDVDLKTFIITEVSKNNSTETAQRAFIQKLNKELRYLKKTEENRQANVKKIQLEISTSSKEKLTRLSKNAGTTNSKFFEDLIRYADNNRKLFFNEKVEREVLNVFTKTKNKEIVKMSIASDKLDERLSNLEERLGKLVGLVEPLLSEIQQYNFEKPEVKPESVISSGTEEPTSDTNLGKVREGLDNTAEQKRSELNTDAINMATIRPSD
ncbi:hypothetical protein PSEHALCIP103_03684 [Pseudoalteromonas haloplanktis]|uniref:Uncharacterized protein n=1 Tax=Pseudoalteromonas haloplanktis TaxID=228 RepID=A0A9W4R3S9_PSEHA|nr:hypothetical protein [Pseudoalteromonas haloplanktis]CAH9066912.1 hypothetical protein PSEHALCIP103_03684 [Pseudoalteromonas haloplanktis]